MTDIAHKLLAFAWDQRPAKAAVIIFMTTAILSFLIEMFVLRTKIRFVDFFQYCFPLKGWKSRSALMDFVLMMVGRVSGIFTATFDTAVTVAGAAFVAGLLREVFPFHVAMHAGIITQAAVVVVLCIFVDLGLFWTHYLEHNVDFLWEIHKVHHSATFLNPMTAVRTHPLSERFEQLGVIVTLWLPMGVIMYLFHLNYVEIALLLATGQRLGGLMTLEVLHHTQFPVSYGWLDYIIVSPRVHQAHHSADYEHWDRNIGIRLAIWDLMCGTLVLPPKGATVKSGIGRGETYDKRYHTFYGAFVQSVIDSGRVLFGLPVAELPPPTSLAEKGLSEPVKQKKDRSRAVSLPPAE